ncbi:glutamine--tRNA ligase [Candidatus Tremblaya phenacola]
MSNYMPTSINYIQKLILKDLLINKYKLINTRFPPEPNGYLHIGHAKAIWLNFGIVETYKGICNLRFDDTNPTEEAIVYVKSIKKDIRWLGFKWNERTLYSSDYFDKLYMYAIGLIIKGLVYVDSLSQKDIKLYRGTLKRAGINSPYRNRDIKESLILYANMKDGKAFEGKACLRAKLTMSSPTISMRDPILYRVKYIKHYHTGNKWCIYPMYDFTHCISDAIEKITHSLCTLEFQDNKQLYSWLLANINIDIQPKQYEYSRLALEHNITSKRKLTILVKTHIVEDWNDPRIPTISGLRRKGYTGSSIREFCRCVNVTRQASNIELNVLEACIREELVVYTIRIMAVVNPIKLIIINISKTHIELIKITSHPTILEMGNRELVFSKELYIDKADFREVPHKQYKRLSLGKEVRLRNAYVIKADTIVKDIKKGLANIYCTYVPYTFNKAPIDNSPIYGVIHWVSSKGCIKAEFRIYDKLFNIKDPTASISFLNYISTKSLVIYIGLVEAYLLKISIGDRVQVEREGFFCVKAVCFSNITIILNRITTLNHSLRLPHIRTK